MPWNICKNCDSLTAIGLYNRSGSFSPRTPLAVCCQLFSTKKDHPFGAVFFNELAFSGGDAAFLCVCYAGLFIVPTTAEDCGLLRALLRFSLGRVQKVHALRPNLAKPSPKPHSSCSLLPAIQHKKRPPFWGGLF